MSTALLGLLFTVFWYLGVVYFALAKTTKAKTQVMKVSPRWDTAKTDFPEGWMQVRRLRAAMPKLGRPAPCMTQLGPSCPGAAAAA